MHRGGPDNRDLIGGAYNNYCQGRRALDRLMAERQRRSQMLTTFNGHYQEVLHGKKW